MPTHVVKQGEHLYRIARQYGFPKYDIIWDHPENAALKQQRKSPHVLFPGDQLFIPEKQTKVETRSTGKMYRFQVDSQSLKLKFIVRDEDDQPLANTACRLNVQGRVEECTTDGDGKLESFIPATAEDAMLDISGVQIPIRIGHLDPVDKRSGQQARLNNLGYDAGPVGETDEERFRSAVEEFQCDRKMQPVTGVCDAATQDKLKQAHGS